MKRTKKENEGYYWLCTSLYHNDGGDYEEKILRKNPTWKIIK
jgi:hypothetical protein